MKELTPKQYMQISKKHFDFINKFVFKFCKDKKMIDKFFKHFNAYVNNEIGISKIFD